MNQYPGPGQQPPQQQQYQPQQQVYYQVPQGNGLAMTGMILGIIGLVLFWTSWFAIILALLAIIFGAIGVAKPVKKGMGIAGIILGVVTLILAIIWPALLLAAIFS